MLSEIKKEKKKKIYVIGGASIYEQFFKKSLIDSIELTLIHALHEGDSYI